MYFSLQKTIPFECADAMLEVVCVLYVRFVIWNHNLLIPKGNLKG